MRYVLPISRSLQDERFAIIRPELECRGSLAALIITSPNRLALTADAQAKAKPGRVQEALRLRVVWMGQVLNIGEAQIPALVKLGRLRFLPEVVHRATNEDFDVNALPGMLHVTSV